MALPSSACAGSSAGWTRATPRAATPSPPPRSESRRHGGDSPVTGRTTARRGNARLARAAGAVHHARFTKEIFMAATDSTFPERRVRVSERRHDRLYPNILQAEGKKVSWGGIFGGVLVAVGVLVLLAALGMAIGISAAEPGETDASTLGMGAGIWAALSLLAALFIGGMVSTRIGAISDRTTGFFEGVLVWVVSILLM